MSGNIQGLIASNPGIHIFSGNYDDLSFGGTSTCFYRVRSQGDSQVQRFTIPTITEIVGEWYPSNLAGTGAPVPGYEMRATLVAGSLTNQSQALGTWFSPAAGGGTNFFGNTQSPPAVSSGTIQFDVRNAATLAIVATGQITLRTQ